MHNEKIACIIPVKNRKKLVIEAIDSVINQDHPVDEIIIVDDGSTDGTYSEIKRLFFSSSNLRVIKSKDLGPGAARNVGVKYSSADIIMFLDSDDLWLKDHTLTLFKSFEKGIDASFGITENRDLTNNDKFYIPGPEFDRKRSISENLLRWCSIVPSSFAIKKRAFLHLGGFEQVGFGEDWSFFIKAAKKINIYFIDKVITVRRLHGENICQKGFSIKEALSLLYRILEIATGLYSESQLEIVRRNIKITKELNGKCQSVQQWYLALTRNLQP